MRNSNLENIITNLKLSEAIKLLEKNEGAELWVPQYRINFIEAKTIYHNKSELYSVKLPPPKSVVVTKDKLVDAWLEIQVLLPSNFDKFCKELGL